MTGFTEIAAAGPVLVAIGVSVLAGLISFASPCVVPLVPGYLSYLAAVVGVDEGAAVAPRKQRFAEEDREETRKTSLSTKRARWRVAGAALLFVAGFTTVFLLGTVAVLGMTTT